VPKLISWGAVGKRKILKGNEMRTAFKIPLFCILFGGAAIVVALLLAPTGQRFFFMPADQVAYEAFRRTEIWLNSLALFGLAMIIFGLGLVLRRERNVNRRRRTEKA